MLNIKGITGISCDSKSVRRGDLFVAVKGRAEDGHDYIQEALQRGASCIVAEDTGKIPEGARHIIVEDSRRFLSEAAHIFYGRPSEKIKVLGITGTNGKTTTTYLIEAILRANGLGAGRMGTVEYKLKDRTTEAVNTTPGPLELHRLLSDMADSSLEYAVIEVSSHALQQHRVDDIRFEAALFTNLTQDHLDYHKDMEGYFRAKSLLFELLPKEKTACINIDDPYIAGLSRSIKARLIRYSAKGKADIYLGGVRSKSIDGTDFTVSKGCEELHISTPLIGMHNVYNILGAMALGLSQGFSLVSMRDAVASVRRIPGRLERLKADAPFDIFVDYAHTPDALFNALSALKEICRFRLICVFGCGGDRDRRKRPAMGRIASALSDFVVVTSDNPRSEAPAAIINEVIGGFAPAFGSYELIPDRRDAIGRALEVARSGDIIAICGKGHEKYQIIDGRRIPFDDRAVAEEILKGAATWAC